MPQFVYDLRGLYPVASLQMVCWILTRNVSCTDPYPGCADGSLGFALAPLS